MMPINDSHLYVKTQLIADHQAMQDLKSGTRKEAPRVAHRMWHAMRHDLKILTAPIWWPVSKLLTLTKGRGAGSETTDPLATDLNRPLYK